MTIIADFVRQEKEHKITPPAWLASNMMFMHIHGSESYGCARDHSDKDIYGVCIPPKGYIFPHTLGLIYGYDKIPVFDQYQQHGVYDNDNKYDWNIYGIVNYFSKCVNCNPNFLDSLFTPRRCIVYTTPLWEQVLSNRKLFLGKRLVHTKIKNYAYSQVKKLERIPEGSRLESYQEHGYDLKFAYNIVRLIRECEMFLKEGDCELDRYREEYKSIRRGEWTLDQIKDFAHKKNTSLDELYEKSTLPEEPEVGKVKQILLNVIEQHYGNIENFEKQEVYRDTLVKIREIASSVL